MQKLMYVMEITMDLSNFYEKKLIYHFITYSPFNKQLNFI